MRHALFLGTPLYVSTIMCLGIFILLVRRRLDQSQGVNLVGRSSSLVDHPELSTIPRQNISLGRRDDYICGPGKPCLNGACCGASGYCGYGTDN